MSDGLGRLCRGYLIHTVGQQAVVGKRLDCRPNTPGRSRDGGRPEPPGDQQTADVDGRRQFDRAFSAETGQTPAKAIEKLRAEAARPRVEAGQESLETIARAVGFEDPERMRRAFLRVFGYPPQAMRRATREQEALYR